MRFARSGRARRRMRGIVRVSESDIAVISKDKLGVWTVDEGDTENPFAMAHACGVRLKSQERRAEIQSRQGSGRDRRRRFSSRHSKYCEEVRVLLRRGAA